MKALGPAAFDTTTDPLFLLELAAALESLEEEEEAERFGELAVDLATIRNLPEVSS